MEHLRWSVVFVAIVAIVASAPIATSLAAPTTKSAETDAGTGPNVDAGRATSDAGSPARIAAPVEGSLEYLIEMAARLAQEQESRGQAIALLERQVNVMLGRRNQTLEAIRREEAKAATSPTEGAQSQARIAQLRAELDAIDREIASLRARLVQERTAERRAQEERARVQAAIDARRRPTVKAPLRSPSPVQR